MSEEPTIKDDPNAGRKALATIKFEAHTLATVVVAITKMTSCEAIEVEPGEYAVFFSKTQKRYFRLSVEEIYP